MTWDETFLALYDRCASAYQDGNQDYLSYYSPEDLEFLDSIGYQPREFFDFVEDFCSEGTPSPSTALLIAAARRDYFEVVQNSTPSDATPLSRDDIPTFGDELAGIPYLPRIIAKARAKLRGELDPDLMYGCGGDRNFLSKNGDLHPADFLRRVWAAGDHTDDLIAWIQSQKS
jgi:hypothetical protein